MKILKCFKRYILYRYKEISLVDNRLESWSVRNDIFFFKRRWWFWWVLIRWREV